MRSIKFLFLGLIFFGVFLGLPKSVSAYTENTEYCICIVDFIGGPEEGDYVNPIIKQKSLEKGKNVLLPGLITSLFDLSNVDPISQPIIPEISLPFVQKIPVDCSTIDWNFYVGTSSTDNFKSDVYKVSVNDCGDFTVPTVIKPPPKQPPPKQPTSTGTFLIPSAQSLNKLGTDVPAFIGRVIKTLMGVVGSIALVMFIYGGLSWMMARGNGEKQKKALDTLLWAGLGIMVILSSYALINFILDAFL
jgi:hypothetical protein